VNIERRVKKKRERGHRKRAVWSRAWLHLTRDRQSPVVTATSLQDEERAWQVAHRYVKVVNVLSSAGTVPVMLLISRSL